jgi:hypothetical protein
MTFHAACCIVRKTQDKENEMTTQAKAIQLKAVETETANSDWKSIRIIGGLSALLIVLTAVVEIAITFLPAGYTTTKTVVDWFKLLQDNEFLGLRNLGLLNIVMVAMGIPLVYCLYAAHRDGDQTFAALAMIVSFLGTAVFYATNQAFPMFELSNRYAAATTQAERTVIEAAGQTILSVGQSHTAGTFLAFMFSEIGGMLMAVVALRGKIFGTIASLAGLIGYGVLFIFEILSSFAPSTPGILIFAMFGGLLNIAWYILVARRFFQLERSSKAA